MIEEAPRGVFVKIGFKCGGLFETGGLIDHLRYAYVYVCMYVCTYLCVFMRMNCDQVVGSGLEVEI